jgi:hypothetical protein
MVHTSKMRMVLAVFALLFGGLGASALTAPVADAATCGPYGHWSGAKEYRYAPGGWCAKGINGTQISFQGDGNLVVSRSGHVAWASNTARRGATRLAFQRDGNLVIYAGSAVLWSSHTSGHPQTASYDYYLYVGDYIGCHGRGVEFTEAQIKLNKSKIWGSYCSA